ncbi:MAG TPA: YceI family protein [Edaphocola sp.]|nr:YceI family protein [Edaphocola sp.]
MKKLVFLIFATVLSGSLIAQTTNWTIDKAHSRLAFTVVHLGLSDIEGDFKDFDVKIKSAKADFSDAIFEMTSKINSINTGIEKRDKHLKSPDFFDATKNPTMTFISSSIKKVGKNKFKLTGNLTIAGVTKKVTMDLIHRGTIDEKDHTKRAAFQLTGTINRKDFNVGTGTSKMVVSETVKIKADGAFKNK